MTLSDASLSDAIFSHAELTHANPRGADLSYAILDVAKLTGADLTGANLTPRANLTHANLTRAKGLQLGAPRSPTIKAPASTKDLCRVYPGPPPRRPEPYSRFPVGGKAVDQGATCVAPVWAAWCPSGGPALYTAGMSEDTRPGDETAQHEDFPRCQGTCPR